MNSTITFPPAEPTLKLARPSAEKWAATLAEERRRLQEDHEALREREQNLRDYEARLRSLQAELEGGRAGAAPAAPSTPARGTTLYQRPGSQTPFHEDPALQLGWEKLHRARELLEAEQRNLRDERIAMRELESQVKRREDALTAREQKVAEREALIIAATPTPEASEVDDSKSAVTKFTRAPFKMARSVFKKK